MKSHVAVLFFVFAVIGILGGCAGAGSETGQASGYIKVPDGPKIRVVFSGPPELELRWEKLGVSDDPQLGYLIQIVGNIRNVSSETVDFVSVDYLFDGNPAGFQAHSFFLFAGNAMKPGEQWQIIRAFAPYEYSERTKVLEVRIRGFEKSGAP